MSKNLRPYQWQIGDVVYGPRHNLYKLLNVTRQSYNVANQDFQVPLADELRPGQDTLQAGPIVFKIGVIDNAPVRHLPNTLPPDLVTKSSKLLTALQKEWKADEVRQRWGALKPLTYCDGYGVTRQIFGRPRKFDFTLKTPMSQWHTVTAEYQPFDTLSYTETEYQVSLVKDAAPAFYTRDGGDALSWFRVVLTGPQTNPFVVVGQCEIQLQYTIPAGVRVEVNSYPWSRRIIDSNGFNLRTTLIGNTPYLDQLRIPANDSIPMSWNATGTTGASACNVLWRDALNTL